MRSLNSHLIRILGGAIASHIADESLLLVSVKSSTSNSELFFLNIRYGSFHLDCAEGVSMHTRIGASIIMIERLRNAGLVM